MLTSGNVASDMDEDHHDSPCLSCHKEARVAQEAPRNVDVLRMKTARMEYSKPLRGIIVITVVGMGELYHEARWAGIKCMQTTKPD